jgi:hypothetical protein
MPVWNLTVNLKSLWGVTEITFPSKRDGIVKLIKESGWDQYTDDVLTFEALVDELAETADNRSFDAVFQDLYDLADNDRVWIETQ